MDTAESCVFSVRCQVQGVCWDSSRVGSAGEYNDRREQCSLEVWSAIFREHLEVVNKTFT